MLGEFNGLWWVADKNTEDFREKQNLVTTVMHVYSQSSIAFELLALEKLLSSHYTANFFNLFLKWKFCKLTFCSMRSMLLADSIVWQKK